MAYIVSRYVEVAEWSTHISSLSTVVWVPVGVESKVHVAPPAVDLYRRSFCVLPEIPIVMVHAVPSEVQSTAGSELKLSPEAGERVVCPQVAPPSVDQNWAWKPLPPMLLEAEMILLGFRKFTRMSDSLRGAVAEPETRRLPPIEAARAPTVRLASSPASALPPATRSNASRS